MRSGRGVSVAAGLLICGAAAVRGEFDKWVQHEPSGPVIGALFRSVAMPNGAVPIRRPPSETRPALTKLISAAPRDAALYRLRAQEAEMALDFAAAEADWKTYAQTASDSFHARIELADFYHRRVQPRDEIIVLTEATAEKDDPLLSTTDQKAWQAFERMASVIADDALPQQVSVPVFRAWVLRYPKEPEARRRLIDYLIKLGQFAASEREITSYGRAFQDDIAAARMRADLELQRGAPDAAIRAYDQAFRPLWPDDACAGYFKLLEDQGRLRDFVGGARSALQANATDLNATARLFHCFHVQNNASAARRVLLEYRIAKERSKQAWTADELETVARLFERLPDANEAARLYYALYSLPPAGGAHVERAIYSLANLLLTAPEQPIRFGSGDLSFYKDIATVDPSPGFLNGILSLVLNSTGARWEYERQDEKSAAYFHRAAASRLATLLEQRFPRSSYRAPLRAALVSAYATYGDNDAVVRAGREYLTLFPAGASRVQVAMSVADALARQNKETEEFALYDQLLRELAAKATGVPIGAKAGVARAAERAAPPPAPNFELQSQAFQVRLGLGNPPAQPNQSSARSPEYVQILDRYLARLASLRRPVDALRVYRTEIDRNPNDPGLYERLAAFLDQNGMASDVEDVYRRAISKFADRSWYHKLARWYLRNRQTAALERISREAIGAFSGSDLEAYFGDVVSQANPDAVLYRQLNLYAHERFPEDLTFVRNLLSAYSRRETYDNAAAERLLRQYWFYDPELRARLFTQISQQGRLYPELAQIRSANADIVAGRFDQALAANPAAVQFDVEAEAWLCHFEAAAPGARALAAAYPGRQEFTTRAADLYRSLAAYFPEDTEVAAGMMELERKFNPRDPNTLAKTGDVLADRERYDRARTYWDRMPESQPGKPEAYLEVATIYWDYYLYSDALRWIASARTKFHDPALFAYQAGAIYEGRRDFQRAVHQYLAGAIAGEDDADRRLIRLAMRPPTRDIVEQATTAAFAADHSQAAFSVRVEVLEAQQRRNDLEELLRGSVETATTLAGLNAIEEAARRQGFDVIEERAGERQAAITNDPVDKMRLTLAAARLYESKKDLAGAARILDALYRDNPLVLGVVRGVVDFHVRNHQSEEAIGILLDAARHARTDLANQFTLEAARDATEAGRFEQARGLLTQLLAAAPYRPEYLAAMAETYLRAKDDRGFRDYELAAIERLKSSPLSPTERIANISALRRSLIPALDRLTDHAGAVAQYIELIDNYPEDEALTREAAAYAVAHGQVSQLTGFYRQTIANAPRDYRWPTVLGRIETVAEDYPAAIADYERALEARSDRPAVLESKAQLEERLMRFDDAIKSYNRLYELTYRDPQWLVKVAELQARSGKAAEVVAALRTAVIGARSETADADFDIAQRLERWSMIAGAVQFAEHGADLAGADLFTGPQRSNAVVYARVMARARLMDAVLSRVQPETRLSGDLAAAAGSVIAECYTPEEKAAFEESLIARAAGMPRPARDAVLLPFAESAGLYGLESAWRYESMAAGGLTVDARFAQLQSERGLYADLGRQLEEYAGRHPGAAVESTALNQAAGAFVSEGDIDGQLRTMRKLLDRGALNGALLERYLTLLAARNPQDLLALARVGASSEIRNRAVQAAIANGQPQLAYSAVRSRGGVLPPVWSKAYTALAGVYFNDRDPAIGAAFEAVLDTRTIGERIKTPVDAGAAIAGANWFYYGARYGEYLAGGKDARAEVYLPAREEAAPQSPNAYVALGDFYAEAGQAQKAIAQFDAALQLDSTRGDAHDHAARVLWSQGRRDEAMARWRAALAAFLRTQSRGVRVPETFWAQVGETFTDIGDRKALAGLRGDMALLLADYIHRNGGYRLRDLLEPAARASLASGEDLSWLLALYSPSDADVLWTLEALPDLTPAQRVVLARYRVAVETATAASQGREFDSGSRFLLVEAMLTAGDVAGASAEWNLIREESRKIYAETEVRLAARAGGLDQLLARYRAKPDDAPPADTLRDAARELRGDHNDSGARTVLEFVYDREIQSGHLEAANFLGLAGVKLEENDAPSALALLNRMALVADDAFDTLVPAGDLLLKYSKTSDAADFFQRRVKAVPWDAEAKLRLGGLKTGPDRQALLAGVIADAQSPYRLRADAAASNRAAAAPGTELALLASGVVSPAAASKPYYLESRIAAAGTTSDPETRFRLWREALAIEPEDERARLGAVEAGLSLKHDAFALSASRPTPRRSRNYFGENPYEGEPHYQPWNWETDSSLFAWHTLNDAQRASLAVSLAAAAERAGELSLGQDYLRSARNLAPPDERAGIEAKLHAIEAEQDRRTKNAARRPLVKDVIDQDQVVRAIIPGGTR